MIIDWFTVLAQVLNFLILVWLMKRFLYKPILNTIDAREQKIAETLASAEKIKTEAQIQITDFKRKNEEFEEHRKTQMNKATHDANAEYDLLIDKARNAAADLSLKHQETLQHEKHSLDQSIIQRTQKEVFAITRKVLADLSGTSLEERMVDVFIRKLRSLSKEEKEPMKTAFKDSLPIIVRTTFNLSATLQSSIEAAIKESLNTTKQIHFEMLQDLICGIELTTNEKKLAWSIAEYLKSLEKGLNEILKEKENKKPEIQLTTRNS